MIDGHGYIKLPEAPAAPARRKIVVGAQVKITGGPFAGHRGLYQGQSTRERERILLDLILGSSRPVLIHHNLVSPVGDA
jgi:transcription antitermination factor NusG